MATRFIIGNVSSQSAPAGTIQAFAGSTIPNGWLACDGTAVSRTTYAGLFASIGTTHGTGNGTTTFHLPDYRGRMLRGGDSLFGGTAANRDPDKASRTAMNAGGNVGNNVGSVQAQATSKNGLVLSGSAPSLTGTTSFSTASHKHLGTTGTSDQKYFTRPNGSVIASVSNSPAGSSNSFGGPGLINISFTGNADASASVGITGGSFSLGTGDNETRPINAYVNYIIKV